MTQKSLKKLQKRSFTLGNIGRFRPSERGGAQPKIREITQNHPKTALNRNFLKPLSDSTLEAI